MEISREDTSASHHPVTYIIRRRVKVGRHAEFEDWLAGINRAALRFDGHLGVNVIRPSDPSTDDYVIIWRFDSYDNLKGWEDSALRKEWLDRSWEMTEGSPDIQKLAGLEFWFTTPPAMTTLSPPPKGKMAIAVIIALYPLLMVLHFLLNPVFVLVPLAYPLQLLVTVIIAVYIMTFFLMPFMTRLFARWLYS